MLGQTQDLQGRIALVTGEGTGAGGVVFTRVSEEYGLPPQPRESRLAGYNTLGKVADRILTSAA